MQRAHIFDFERPGIANGHSNCLILGFRPILVAFALSPFTGTPRSRRRPRIDVIEKNLGLHSLGRAQAQARVVGVKIFQKMRFPLIPC